jgi:hypothetical protein
MKNIKKFKNFSESDYENHKTNELYDATYHSAVDKLRNKANKTISDTKAKFNKRAADIEAHVKSRPKEKEPMKIKSISIDNHFFRIDDFLKMSCEELSKEMYLRYGFVTDNQPFFLYLTGQQEYKYPLNHKFTLLLSQKGLEKVDSGVNFSLNLERPIANQIRTQLKEVVTKYIDLLKCVVKNMDDSYDKDYSGLANKHLKTVIAGYDKIRMMTANDITMFFNDHNAKFPNHPYKY